MTGSCHRNYSDRLSLSLSLLAGPRKACFPEPPVVWELAQSSPVSERVRAESWGIWTDTREIFYFFTCQRSFSEMRVTQLNSTDRFTVFRPNINTFDSVDVEN